jgi:tetratricopeptide (TPR) repeat protein
VPGDCKGGGRPGGGGRGAREPRQAYRSQGDFSKGIKHLAQHLAIAKEVGDRVGEGTAYANLGSAYDSKNDFSKAMEFQTQCLAIAMELGDRAGEARACGNLV